MGERGRWGKWMLGLDEKDVNVARSKFTLSIISMICSSVGRRFNECMTLRSSSTVIIPLPSAAKVSIPPPLFRTRWRTSIEALEGVLDL